MLPSAETDEPTCRGSEAAGLKIERFETVFEIDMQPLAARSPSLIADHGDHLGTDSLVPICTTHHRVLDPGMRGTIPHEVCEANQTGPVSPDNPSKAVPLDHLGPIAFVLRRGGGLEGLAVQCIDFGILEWAAPLDAQ